jgi:hypothetical protein
MVRLHVLIKTAYRILPEYLCFGTERRSPLVNTPASCSGGPGSDLVPKTGCPDWGFSCFSSVPPGKCRDRTCVLGNCRFLSNPFQFMIHLSSFHSTLYSLQFLKSVVKSATNRCLSFCSGLCYRDSRWPAGCVQAPRTVASGALVRGLCRPCAP